MNENGFKNLVASFGDCVSMKGLSPEADGTLNLRIDDISIHVDLSERGDVTLWTVLENLNVNAQTLQDAMELNFLFSIKGDGTISLNKSTGALLFMRAENMDDRTGEFLEARIASFLTAVRLALKIDDPEMPREDADAHDYDQIDHHYDMIL